MHNLNYYIWGKTKGKIKIDNSQDEKTKNFIIKCLYLLLYHIMTVPTLNYPLFKNYILGKITDLYKQGFLSEPEILLYIKFLITLGNKSSNIFRYAFVLLDSITKAKNDNNISNQIIYNIIKFTKDTVVQNNKKKYLLALMINITDLLMFDHVDITEITQKAINDLLIQIYLFQYRNNLFFNLIKYD